MGDVQSAQREGAVAAAVAAEEEEVQVGEQEEVQVEEQEVLVGGIGKVDDVQSEQRTEDKPLTNGGQIAEMNGMADSGVAAFNGHCEDQNPGKDQDVKGRQMSREEKEQTPLQKVDEADSAEEEPADLIEMETKQNDINETFRKFFSNIGLKLTVKRGSTDTVQPATRTEEEPQEESGEELVEEPEEEPQEEPEEELQRPDYINNILEEVQTESSDQRMDGSSPQEVCDNDSTTCPTMTDGTSEDFAENAEEKTTGTKEEVECEHVDLGQDATNEEEQHTTSAPVEEVVASPLKKFFTTGIFSGLQKKKKSIQDEMIERELVDRGLKQTAEKKEKPSQDQEKLIISGVETSPTEKEVLESEPEEILSSPSPSTDPSIIIVTGTEILSSQEKVPASPLRRFLSGSSLRRLSKKQGSRRSSDGKLSDSGEYVSDHLVSSTESADRQKEESPPQESPGGPVEEQWEEEEEEGSTWASFKKLMTPKKRIKRPSVGGDEAPTSGAIMEGKPGEGGQISKDGKMFESGELVSQCVPSATEKEAPPQTSPEEEGAWASFIKLMTPKKCLKKPDEEAQNPEIMVEMKPSSGEQISDQSTEEGKKRKDSSVSWEAVLCGSGRKRSRKTSDSESETPQTDEQKRGTDSPLESSSEAHKTGTSSPEKAESPAESDERLTWKLFKKLVTPKKKAKEVHESRDGKQSDSESMQDDSFFSVKKNLSVRKKTKSAEKSDQASSDEADKDATSYDEDSETPAVVPLSEFDTAETVVHIQTQADIESYTRKETDEKLQQDLLDEIPKTAEENDEKAAGNEVPTAVLQDAEAGDSSDLVSKHQQLSDIPEEGVVTETGATMPSVTEEVARDDTMAEDLIEITSEALTAPEPTDVTTADETEMVSAVSRLSESSKTSGDTTPVPDESSDRDTEALLQQAAETIDSTLTASSEETSSEGIVYTVWNQILKTFGKEKSKDDADLDVVEEDAAQTESVSDVNDALSTEIRLGEFDTVAGTVDVSQLQEDSKESEITAGSQTQSADMEQAQQIVAENKAQIVSNDLGEQDQVGAQQSDAHTLGEEETVAEIPVKVSLPNKPSEHEDVEAPETELQAAALDKEAENSHALQKQAEPEEETSPCIEGTVGAVGAPDVVETTSDSEMSSLEKKETSGAETEPKTKCQEMIQFILDVPAVVKKVIDEPKNEPASTTEPAVDPDVSEAASAITEADCSQTIESETVLEDVKASERVQDEMALPVGEQLEEEPTILLDTEADISQMATNKTKSEDVQTAEAVPNETGEEPPALDAATFEETEKNEPKEETELETKYPKVIQFILDVPAVEKKVMDEPKKEAVSPTEEPEELEAAAAVTSDTEAENSHILETEGKSETIEASEAVKDETMPPIVEPVEASDVLDAAPTILLDPETSNSQSIAAEPNDAQIIQKEETSADISAAEGEKDEVKDETESMLKSPRLQRMFKFIKKVRDEPKNEEISPTKTDVASVDPLDTERVPEPEEVEAAGAVTSDTQAENSHILETEGKSETIEAPEAVKDETKPLAKAIVEPVEASDLLEVASTILLDPETNNSQSTAAEWSSAQIIQKEETSTDTLAVGEKDKTESVLKSPRLQRMFQFIKKVLDEPKNEEISPTETNVPVDPSDTELVPELEEVEAAGAVTLDTEAENSHILETEGKLEAIEASEAVKDETTPLTKSIVEPVEASTIILDPEANNSQLITAEPSSAQILQKKETASGNLAVEGEKYETASVLKSPRLQRMFQFIKKVLDEPKQEPTSQTETDVAPEDASEIDRVPEPEELEAAGAATSDTEAKDSHVIETEVNPEAIEASETVKDETMPTIVEPVEASDVLDAAPTIILDPEAKNSLLIAAEPNNTQIIQKEETATDISAPEGEKDKVKDKTVSLLKSPRLQRMFQFIKKVVDEPKNEETSDVAPEDASEIEPEELEAAAAVTSDKEAEDSHVLETGGKSETTEAPEGVNDETTPPIVEPVEASDVLDAAPTIILGAEARKSQLLAKEMISEETEAAEMPGDETKVSSKDLNDAPQLLETASALDSEPSGAQIIQKEETSADISAAEAEKNETESVLKSPRLQRMFQRMFIKKVLDEPKQEPTSPTETDVALEDASDIERVDEPGELEAAAALTSDTGSDNSKMTEKPEETSEEIPETERKEPEEETEAKTNYPKVIQFILDVPALVKKVMDEPKKESTDTDDAPETEHVEEAGRPQELQTEATSENLQEKVREETTALTKDLDEAVSAQEVLPGETSKTEKEILQVAEKEMISEDIQARETVTEEPVPISEETVEVSEPAAATLDSEPSDVKLLDKEETLEDTSAAETDDNEAETEAKSPTLQKMFQFILDVPAAVKRIIKEPETEARSSSETDEASVEAPKDDDAQETPESEAGVDETSSPKLDKENTGDIKAGDETASPDEGIGEQVDVPEVEETEPDTTLDSEPIVPQILEKEDVPEKASPAETEQMEVKTKEAHTCKVVEAPTLESEVRSPQLVEEEEVKSEEASPPGTAEEDKKEEREPHIEVDDNRIDGAVKLVQERQTVEADGPMLLKEQSEDVETVETAEVEPTKEAEDSVKVSEIEELQATEVPQAEATLGSEEQISEVVSATEVKEVTQVVTSDSETVRPPSLEMQEISEDVAPTETVTEAGGGETTPLPGDVEPEETSEIKHVPEPEAAEALNLDSEARSAQTLEKEEALEVDAKPEKTEAPPAETQTEDAVVETSDVQEKQTEKREAASRLDDVSETNQDQKTESAAPEVQFEHEEGATEAEDAPKTSGTLAEDKPSSVSVLLETATVGETSTESAEVLNEPTSEEIKTETVQEVEDTTYRLEEVSARESSEEHEPLIVSETELNETTKLVGVDATETAETTAEVAVIHAPTVEPNDDHRIQVHVVDVDVRSVDGTVETTLDVGVTRVTEVIDVCHKTIEGLNTLSATPETEGGATDEEKLVTVEEVVQLLKNPPEPGPEQEEVGVEQQETVTEVSETIEGKSKEAEDEEDMKESSEEPESSAVLTEPVSGEHRLEPENLGGLEVSVESKKTEADMETLEGGDCSEDFITKVQTESEVLEDAGIVSSVGDETSAETSSAPHSDKTLDSTQAKSSDADIQTGTTESENATQEAESDNQNEKSVQAAENLEPAERVDTTNQPVTQSEETTEPEEQITSPGDVQAAETMEPMRQTEEDEVHSPTGPEEVQSPTGPQEVQNPTGPEEVQIPTGPAEVCDDELNEEKPSEEETDQDVWLDAEEDIYSQKELEASKSESNTEDGDGQPGTEGGGGGGRGGGGDKGGESETESEGEADDFAIALEDLELTSIVPKEED